ncbi:porin [Parathalassolituus penaei]|uniref:Porin n=1 Tax=Parathalassolituus penaei TaxID=2997323 RepID=A0A9X3ITE3_9GAMM|nr:porin [Parathalassolituus penaei]MCY0966801.1 porin [Parathalassolituus penaei]
MQMTKLAIAMSATLLSASLVQAEELSTSFYGTLRTGLEKVDAGVSTDSINGRDYSSAVGVKAALKMDNGLTGLGQVEYGLVSEDGEDFEQKAAPTLRYAIVGLQGDFGKLTYGSQATLFHTYVRSPYFADGNDTIRLGTSRDDELTHYQFTGANYSVAAGLLTEDRDGDNVDSWTVAGDYKVDALTLQAALQKDQRGDNKGRLAGVRAWYKLNDKVTLSVYRHQQSAKFDLHGGSSGYITADGVSGVGSCSGEKRSATGVYAAYMIGADKLHGRYAIDSCDAKGDVASTKVEYIHALTKTFSAWASYEVLNSDDTRTPSTGDDMSAAQLGVRLDF